MRSASQRGGASPQAQANVGPPLLTEPVGSFFLFFSLGFLDADSEIKVPDTDFNQPQTGI